MSNLPRSLSLWHQIFFFSIKNQFTVILLIFGEWIDFELDEKKIFIFSGISYGIKVSRKIGSTVLFLIQIIFKTISRNIRLLFAFHSTFCQRCYFFVWRWYVSKSHEYEHRNLCPHSDSTSYGNDWVIVLKGTYFDTF